MYELSREFRFDAAHTLQRTVDVEPSRRIHGHSYRAEVVVRGHPDPQTGMIIDLSLFDKALEEARDGLDHRFLDEISDLGPTTIENLSSWIWRKLAPVCPNLWRVTVRRDSDTGACSFYGSESL
ncbi:6-carboxytetrahydropterin synthase [Mesorhizobium sp.]|uniref:6-pyruvoyl trahydropterin synthase family protein n=1 Tax=Mesorhizobium sp. TaxID=1871066 RepID=UPI000FE4B1BE|nr:6-carboxytetrahydropterin synthase [Mesorhizobium sp.]RWC47193.1 MAG: 6-carboxytetrahydropterin synthase [Mesorhizobium sp.]RWE94408.1 MAG: 6-carboxytetrahydropterin synthase [Mesorhizobium sp.]